MAQAITNISAAMFAVLNRILLAEGAGHYQTLAVRVCQELGIEWTATRENNVYCIGYYGSKGPQPTLSFTDGVIALVKPERVVAATAEQLSGHALVKMTLKERNQALTAELAATRKALAAAKKG